MSLLRKLQLAESAPSINGKEVSRVLEMQKILAVCLQGVMT